MLDAKHYAVNADNQINMELHQLNIDLLRNLMWIIKFCIGHFCISVDTFLCLNPYNFTSCTIILVVDLHSWGANSLATYHSTQFLVKTKKADSISMPWNSPIQ